MSLKLQETVDVTGGPRSAVVSFKNYGVQLRRCRKATWNSPNYARTRVTCFWRQHLISVYSQKRSHVLISAFASWSTNSLTFYLSWSGPVHSKTEHLTLVIYWMCCSFADLWPGFTVRTVLASLDPVCSVRVTAAGVCPALSGCAYKMPRSCSAVCVRADRPGAKHNSFNLKRRENVRF